MKLRRRAVLAIAAALAALVALSACSGSDSKDYRFTGAQQVGKLIPVKDRKPAQNVGGSKLSGTGDYSLASDRGKVVVLNFWATWCSPCTVETPQLDNVYRAYRAKGVTIVGVDTKNFPRSSAQQFVQNYNITYPMVYDEKGEIALKLGNIPANGLPFSVLVDKHGRVAAVYITLLTPKDLEPVLNTLRREA